MRLACFIFVVILEACGPVPRGLAGEGPSEAELVAALVNPQAAPYGHFEVASRDSIELVPDGGGVELRLVPGQPKVNNGIRAEVSVDAPFVDGDTVRYEWQVWLPRDFQPDPQNRWWVFADWHDQPDRNLGQTWADFPSHSAPLILGYGHLEGGQVVEGFSVPETSDVLSVTYGVDYRPLGLLPLRRDEWNSIRVDVTWSQNARGAMTLTVNDSPPLKAQGPNMLNAFQHYFKAGQYRNPDINTANRVRLRRVNIFTCANSGCPE